MSQWLPIGQLPNDAIELVARTFVAVFPTVCCSREAGHHLILLGSRSPVRFERLVRTLLPIRQGLELISCGSVSQRPPRWLTA